MPWFEFSHDSSEPAWNGYLSAAKFPPEEIGVTLKPLLLDLFPVIYSWSWGEHLAKVAAQIVIELAVLPSDKPYGLNAKEARQCLRSMNDRNRQDAVFRLGQVGQRKDGWTEYVVPFIDTVWPRERTFRTSNLVSSWVSLLNNTGEKFPDVLRAVRRYLVPVEREHRLSRFRMEDGEEQSLTRKYPVDVLELLDAVTPNSAEVVPYDLIQILDLIEETDPSLVSDRRFVRLTDLIEQT